jgi:glycosyltransferase involved in cell wall biosynthesis
MSSTYPRVSVHLPTYNQRPFVREAIESVLAQGYPNLEIVIGDDGSNDGTQQILQEYKEKNPHLIKLLLAPKNEGITSNCNKILKACTGEYIAIFAGDDVWLPGKLHRQIELMQAAPSAVICATKVEWFDSADGNVIRIYPPDPTVDTSKMSVIHAAAYIAGSGPSLIIRSSAVPIAGFEPSLPMVSDWLFYIEILRKGSAIFDDQVFARYRRHADNTSNKSSIIFREHIQTMNLVSRRYPEMRSDIDEYMEHYLKNNVLSILRAPNGGALKLYSLYVVMKHFRLRGLVRILQNRAGKFLERS